MSLDSITSWFAEWAPGVLESFGPSTQWRPLWLIAGAWLALRIVVFAARHLLRRPRDPKRAFTQSERTFIFEGCQHRCEHKPLMWRRCPRRANHADHILPWSKGGVSDVHNAQGLCATHNLRKSNHMPSRITLARLRWRRRSYHPTNPAMSFRGLRSHTVASPQPSRQLSRS